METIRTARLVLRPFEACDEARLIEILSCEKIQKTYMVPELKTREDADKLFRRLRELSHSGEHLIRGIFLENELIGLINDAGKNGETVEVGYVIHPLYQGSGYATEALGAWISEAFRRGFSCVKAGFFEENGASLRVMEKCGMVLTGETETIEYRGSTHKCLYTAICKNRKNL